MVEVAYSRQQKLAKALDYFKSDPDNYVKIMNAERLQSQMEANIFDFRRIIKELGRQQNLGQNFANSYVFQSSWTSPELIAWLDTFPSSQFPDRLPKYKPPWMSFSWEAAFEDESPQERFLSFQFDQEDVNLKWFTGCMDGRIDMDVHQQIARQLYELAQKRIILGRSGFTGKQLYPPVSNKNLFSRILKR